MRNRLKLTNLALFLVITAGIALFFTGCVSGGNASSVGRGLIGVGGHEMSGPVGIVALKHIGHRNDLIYFSSFGLRHLGHRVGSISAKKTGGGEHAH